MEPLTTALITKGIEQAASRLASELNPSLAKRKLAQLQFLLNKGLPRYLEANTAKCEKLKTLLNRNDPVQIDSIFVPPNFRIGNETISSDTLLRRAGTESTKFVVSGMAGSGKSVFMKHSFRRSLESGLTFYPIFFEFRALNTITTEKGDLLKEVFQSIRDCCPEYSREQFDYALSQGAFFFLFDGFDELSHKNRDRGAEEIIALSRNFYKCPIIVSSRPSDEFVSWEGFAEASLQPFSKDQVVSYLSKVKYDEDRKREFIDAVNNGLYEEKDDFLSNPLLAAMMLLTYDAFGEIPSQIHVFYQKCFDVLAREHDTSKGRYIREFYSKLTLKELERVFMFFCAHSYADRAFQFDLTAMREYCTRAANSCAMDIEPDLLIRDFRESISIMQLDGNRYEFAHRSFQEFFYAKFAVSDRELPLAQKVNWLASKFATDGAIDMIADMDRTYFEESYLIPEITLLLKKLNAHVAARKKYLALRAFYGDILVRTQRGEGSGDETGRLGLSFRITDAKNHYLWRAGVNDFASDAPEEYEMRRLQLKDTLSRAADYIAQTHDGTLGISHRTKEELDRLGVLAVADDRIDILTRFLDRLHRRKALRGNSLSSLISHKYSSRRKRR